MIPKRMNMIVAVDAANGIAKNNDLPWHLPKEYAHFLRQTIQTEDENLINAVIMGRKCWESIPKKFRPLRNRANVILSRTMPSSIDDNVVVVNDFSEALKILTESDRFKNRIETIWNIGGYEVYKLGLEHPWMHKLVITRINKDFDCDLRFPDVNWDGFVRDNNFADLKEEEKGVLWNVTCYTRKNSLF